MKGKAIASKKSEKKTTATTENKKTNMKEMKKKQENLPTPTPRSPKNILKSNRNKSVNNSPKTSSPPDSSKAKPAKAVTVTFSDSKTMTAKKASNATNLQQANNVGDDGSVKRKIKRVRTKKLLVSPSIENMKAHKTRLFGKMSTTHERIIEVLDKLRMNLLELNVPSNSYEKSKRQRNAFEFSVRFSRNFLYPLKGMVRLDRLEVKYCISFEQSLYL